MSQVICPKAGKYQSCEECNHRLPHEPIILFSGDDPCTTPELCFGDGSAHDVEQVSCVPVPS